MRSSDQTPVYFLWDALAAALILAGIWCVHLATGSKPPADPFPFTAEAEGGR